jgi:hypothetical protein
MIHAQRPVGATVVARLSTAFAFAVLAMSSASALATDVRLVSYVSYAPSGNTVDITTDGVQNFDTVNSSNVLRLELWAFPAPYVAGMAGLRLALYPVAPLAGGEQRGVIDSGPVPYSLPPNGVWYYSMQLTEYTDAATTNDGYAVRYFINFPAPIYLGVTPPPQQVTAVEFYHAGLDHYFVAASAQDIADLDNGVHQGWARTGESFVVWDAATADAGPVCRYYIPPGYGDSHFFSASPEECAIATIKFPQLIKETDAAFYIALPDTDTGACLGDEFPVYRLWNGRADSNHRYTRSPTTKAEMIAKGYIAEGYGPDQVDMCSER